MRRNPNAINLKADTNNISNLYDNIIYQTKCKSDFNNSSTQIDNLNKLSPTAVTTSLNMFPTRVPKLTPNPSSTVAPTPPRI